MAYLFKSKLLFKKVARQEGLQPTLPSLIKASSHRDGKDDRGEDETDG